MRKIKIRITYQHEDTGRITQRYILLGEYIIALGERWIIIGKDQFIGFSDNNGEIYENDIVLDHNGRGTIEYSDKYAAFRVNYHNGSCKWFYDYNLKGERESIEVVGNIYEQDKP